ncbi:MAG: hypothetical protein ACLFQX_06770 [Candidatus Kapaibacterium sp.]
MVLAFAVEKFTFLYKFKARHITFFMRRFLETKHPMWTVCYFYEVGPEEVDMVDMGNYIKEKAEFLFVVARHLEQPVNKCSFRRVASIPDLSPLEGKRARVVTLTEKLK